MSFCLLNTLTREVEEFKPVVEGVAGIYTCGPTVYRHAHLGNLRSYLMVDWIRRVLEHDGYTVRHIKNITDVGHMRQEVLEQGQDKIIASALAEGKTPYEIAQFYTDAFLADEAKLNILPAHKFPKATDHVDDMVELTRCLINNGHAYVVEGNVYFSVASFPRYGELSGNTGKGLLEGVRVDKDPWKKDPRDFTLWKSAEPGRTLKWGSPWGEGFPGWHIECSAMSMKYLGEHIDLHTGGVDNIFPHHEGEIAQSEGVTNTPFVGFWVHGQHLLADGAKMAKSAGNAYTLEDLQLRGFDPLAFRYLCGTARYNARLNFTFSALRAAERALTRLRDMAWSWSVDHGHEHHAAREIAGWRDAFWEHVRDNLDLPGAIATLWNVTRSTLPASAKRQLFMEFDEVLGLDLNKTAERDTISAGARITIDQRAELRRKGEYRLADTLRKDLQDLHCIVRDFSRGSGVRAMTNLESQQQRWPFVSSSREISSSMNTLDNYEFSLVVVGCNYQPDIQRCVESALHWSDSRSVQVVLVDNGSTDESSQWMEDTAVADNRIKVIHVDHTIGDAAAKNIGIKSATGHIVVMLDTSVEVTGDIYSPLQKMLNDGSVGVAGPFGLVTEDLRHFEEVEAFREVDAIQGYCFAFRRFDVEKVGLMPETFRFYRNLDIHYSFFFRDVGLRIMANPEIPLRRHIHRVWSELDEEERDTMSMRNFRRFLDRFGQRADLLVNNKTSNIDS